MATQCYHAINLLNHTLYVMLIYFEVKLLSIQLSSEQRERITQALSEKLGITDAASQDLYIDYLEKTGTTNKFSIGSLLTFSHFQNADMSVKGSVKDLFPNMKLEDLIATKPATLPGYKRDFVILNETGYGTPEKPGIALGIEPDEGGETHGGILSTSYKNMDAALVTELAILDINEFFNREGRWYDFQVRQARDAQGNMVPIIGCFADHEGEDYIHNPNNKFAQRNAKYYCEPNDVESRAQIVAEAYGPEFAKGHNRPGHKRTCLNYWHDFIATSIEKNIPVESHIVAFYVSSVEARMKMPEEERAMLERLEEAGRHKNTPKAAIAFQEAVERHNARFNLNSDLSNDINKTIS